MFVGRILKYIVLAAASSVAFGCSIHPLPENTSRSSTFDVVTKIRCEARDAVADLVGKQKQGTRLGRADLDKLLLEGPYAGIFDATTPIPEDKITKAKKFAKETVKRKFLDPRFITTAIGYDFKFTISENNTSAGSATFTMPFSNGKALLGIGLGESRERESDRTFDIVEYFYELLADLDAYCPVASKNWRYPISGRLGIDEVVGTYVRLQALGTLERRLPRTGGGGQSGQESGNRSGDDTRTTGGQQAAFLDEFTFTTTLDGAVEPSIEISPVIHDLRLTKASASFGAKRKDIHKVTFGLITKYTDPDIKNAIKNDPGSARLSDSVFVSGLSSALIDQDVASSVIPAENAKDALRAAFIENRRINALEQH